MTKHFLVPIPGIKMLSDHVQFPVLGFYLDFIQILSGFYLSFIR